jgi:hypothetical protein
MATTIQKNTVSSNASAANSGTMNEGNVRNILIEALSAVRGESSSDISSQFASDGDVKIDSSEAEVMIVALQVQLGRDLPRPSNLCAEQFASVKSLATMSVQSLNGQPIASSAKTRVKATVQTT